LTFGGAPTPGSLALRASVTGGYECAALRAKWMPRTFHKFNVNQHSIFSSLKSHLIVAAPFLIDRLLSACQCAVFDFQETNHKPDVLFVFVVRPGML
jgi:hypothetical protein